MRLDRARRFSQNQKQMKKTLAFLLLFGLTCSLASAQTTLKLIPTESKLAWKGFVKLTFGAGHNGVIERFSGTITTGPDGKIQKGDFTLEMNSIKATDQKEERGNKELTDHLKAADFFDTAIFPWGNFSIISVTYSDDHTATVDGFLGLKGIVNKISFPITIESSGKSIRVKGSVTIDRTKWGVNYQSGSIFANLKDNALSDSVVIELDLRFR